MSRYYSYETIKDNAKDVILENGVKHRCIDPDALLDIESADVRENVKGEWTEEKGYVAGDREWKCSICGETFWNGSMDRYRYCPNCGAQMER